MKAKANYNPVTQAAGAEYSYTVSDHREARKDTLFNGAIGIAVIAVIAVIAWYLWKSMSGTTATITQAISNPVKTVFDAGNQAIVNASNWTFTKAADAAATIPPAIQEQTSLHLNDPIGNVIKTAQGGNMFTLNPALWNSAIILPITSLTAAIQDGSKMNGDQFADYFNTTGGIAGEIFHYGYDLASAAKAANTNGNP